MPLQYHLLLLRMPLLHLLLRQPLSITRVIPQMLDQPHILSLLIQFHRNDLLPRVGRRF